MACLGAQEKLAYRRSHSRLVVKLAANLTIKQSQELCFVYAGEVIPKSFSEKYGDNPLKVLERMQDARVFSYDKPEQLADLMRDMEFFEMQHDVESFIEKNRAIISALSIQHRALPPRPIPCTSGLPTSSHSTQVPPPQPYTQDPCLRPENPTPSAPAGEEGENPYTTFFPAPQRSRHNSADTEYEDQDHSAKSTTSQGSSNEDEIYWEPYQHCILKSTPLGPYPLHRERMKLLVKPLQDIINEGMERRITTEIQCHIPKAKFDLEITSGHTIHDRYLSAKLFLYPGSQLEKEVEDGLYYIHTELQIRQKLKKQKNHQSLYTHSALLDLPQAAEPPVTSSLHPQAAEPPVTSSLHPQAAEPPVTSSLDPPASPDSLPSLQLQADLQQQPHSLETQWSRQHSLCSSDLPPPIQESQSPSSFFQRSSDASLSPGFSRQNGMKLDLCSPSSRVPVASFPAIISHKNFLNQKLISRPYLTLVFTLTQYRQ